MLVLSFPSPSPLLSWQVWEATRPLCALPLPAKVTLCGPENIPYLQPSSSFYPCVSSGNTDRAGLRIKLRRRQRLLPSPTIAPLPFQSVLASLCDTPVPRSLIPLNTLSLALQDSDNKRSPKAHLLILLFIFWASFLLCVRELPVCSLLTTPPCFWKVLHRLHYWQPSNWTSGLILELYTSCSKASQRPFDTI